MPVHMVLHLYSCLCTWYCHTRVEEGGGAAQHTRARTHVRVRARTDTSHCKCSDEVAWVMLLDLMHVWCHTSSYVLILYMLLHVYTFLYT